MSLQQLENHACFGGQQQVWQHTSTSLHCDMRFGVYLPPQALAGQRCPVLYWLSGLTCTEQNFITKAGAQHSAAQHGFILGGTGHQPARHRGGRRCRLRPGQGAGFHLNATQAPWAAHYRMEDYVVQELPRADRAALSRQHAPRHQRPLAWAATVP